MSSAVARPMRSSSKVVASSNFSPWKVSGIVYWPGLDLVDRRRLEAAGDVDAELFCSTEGVVVGVTEVDRRAVGREDLDVQAERLHLLHEHLERLGDAGLLDVLALDDGLVHLDAAEDVVGLDREELLERVCGAVGLEGPHLHLAESLAPELRLTTERLLGDHRVRARRTRVDLVVDEVVQLQDVHVADRDRVRERLAGTAVEELRLAGRVDESLAVAVGERRVEQAADLLLERTVEHRGRDLDAERVEDDVDGGSIGEERHVFDRKDLRDDALVAVAAGELVALGDLALLGDVDHDAAGCAPGGAVVPGLRG